ncbi:MarR family winged helix-turn-helix transcriptional regulator [Streptomyces sp. NPDC092296]|uniref:MarR family winged helix-turn-helix transcriptional regulator n=1 Tax=Streptomyces sp. NPDC092296 TaxID=3366012 RepID=UPI00381F2CDE
MLLARHQVQGARRLGELDHSAYLLLSRLEAEGPMSINQLADAFQLDVSTVNRQTAALLRADLVRRIPDPDGGLARKFSISGEGSRQLAADRAGFHARLAELLADWPQSDVDRLVDALTHFNRSVERAQGRPWPRPATAGRP